MNKNIKYLRLFYITTLFLTLVIGILVINDLIPSEYIGKNPKVLYWVNLYSIVSGLGGMYVALRWFQFSGIRRSVKQGNDSEGARAYCKWNWVRLTFLAVILLSNVLLFHASSYTATPKYCMLITYVTYVFCWPSRTAFESLRVK